MVLYDEERYVNAVQLFLPVLSLKEPEDDAEHKRLNRGISEFVF